jgi:hypothetical protein
VRETSSGWKCRNCSRRPARPAGRRRRPRWQRVRISCRVGLRGLGRLGEWLGRRAPRFAAAGWVSRFGARRLQRRKLLLRWSVRPGNHEHLYWYHVWFAGPRAAPARRAPMAAPVRRATTAWGAPPCPAAPRWTAAAPLWVRGRRARRTEVARTARRATAGAVRRVGTRRLIQPALSSWLTACRVVLRVMARADLAIGGLLAAGRLVTAGGAVVEAPAGAAIPR